MNNKPIRVLVIEDNVDEAGIIGSYLADSMESFALARAPRLSTACHLLSQQDFDVILIDLVLPHSVGLEGFLKIYAMKPAIPIIILTGLQDESLAIQAMKLGAQDYLIKGSPDCCILKRSIRYAIEKKRLSNLIEDLLGTDQIPQKTLGQTPEELIDKPLLSLEAYENTMNRLEHIIEPRNTTSAAQSKQLQEKLREGLHMLEVQNNFMSRISHELRNTLGIMKVATYCLKEGVAESLTARQARMVDMISRNVDHQARLIDNVLDLAQFRSGKFNIQFLQTNVTEIINQVVHEFGMMNIVKQLQVDIECGISNINADRDLIAQVLRNLISNALRFAKGKVVIKALKAAPDGISISIIDDGPGIAPERLGELFGEFVQLDRFADETGHKGTGLGLAICKEIISGHHGKIWAENSSGQGARLSFFLPANSNSKETVATNGRTAIGHDPAPANKQKQLYPVRK